MPWNKDRYQRVKADCEWNTSKGFKSPQFYMNEYMDMIKKDDFEAAKAIAEVLLPLGFDVATTHDSIRVLNVVHKPEFV